MVRLAELEKERKDAEQKAEDAERRAQMAELDKAVKDGAGSKPSKP